MKTIVTRSLILFFLFLFCFVLPAQVLAEDTGPGQTAGTVEGAGKKAESGELTLEERVQGYQDHVRARERGMDEIYGVSGCGKTVWDFLAGQGITTALDNVTNWERVPFADTWGQVRSAMYWQAETELGGAILAVRDDPVAASKHLAGLAARMAEWDRLEQGIQVLFRRALEQTLIIARMKEQSQKIFLSSTRKQKDAELAAIDSQIGSVKRIRDDIFTKIKTLAKERPSFEVTNPGLPLPPGVKKPHQGRSEEGLPLPAKAVEWAADRKTKQLKEASDRASAAEAAAQRAATVAEEAGKDAEFMKKRYEDDLRRADDLRKEYEMTSRRDKKAADKLFEELKRADALAAQSAADWKVDEKKKIAAESESGRLRKEASVAWENYRLLKADIEKNALSGR